MDPVTPKSLLLDLLRVSPRPVPVRQLVSVGALFGLEGNAVRVALTRLVGRGLLASDGRGRYRLAAEADPVSRWVDGWRLGERRLRPWSGAWLCVWHPRGGGRGARAASHRALARLGFREGKEALWFRPDNLRARTGALRAELGQIGLATGAMLFIGRELPATDVESWVGSLWRSGRIAAGHRRALRAIERSRARLDRLDSGAALAESFLVGGAAIRSLAHDPLLPDEIAPGDHRRALTLALHDYDQRGRALWSQVLDLAGKGRIPSHTGAIRAAA